MSLYSDYLTEIETRKGEGLHPKPIEDAALVNELIAQIKDTGHEHRKDSLHFFIYNTLPGTTSAAGAKAVFLKDIIVGREVVEEITPAFAFELLSHMKGGPSVKVLLDLALGDDAAIAAQAADVLKTQVFLYEADTDRLAGFQESHVEAGLVDNEGSTVGCERYRSGTFEDPQNLSLRNHSVVLALHHVVGPRPGDLRSEAFTILAVAQHRPDLASDESRAAVDLQEMPVRFAARGSHIGFLDR